METRNLLTSKQIEQSEQLTREYGSGKDHDLVHIDTILERYAPPDRMSKARDYLKRNPEGGLVVAVLDTMWDWKGLTSAAGYAQAPRYFRINPNNFTGRRLYKLIGPMNHLLVTDSCKELVSSSKEHGTPDPQWLSDNLQIINALRPIDILLICGKVAQRTFSEVSYVPENARILQIPHPAARTWTKDMIQAVSEGIQNGKV